MCGGGLDWVVERGGFCQIEVSCCRIIKTLAIDERWVPMMRSHGLVQKRYWAWSWSRRKRDM
jgi:hypothetical protein